MRLQSYIISEGRTKAISEEAALDLIMSKCGKHIDAINSGKRPDIYRGVSGSSDDYGVIDPSSSNERRSAHTANYGTFLMDNLPAWKGYPKRSQSIICSTTKKGAQSYGTVYYVFPTDKCDIGIVGEVDVWDGFQKTLKVDIPQFNRFLQRLKVSDDSWAKMKLGLIRAFEMDTTNEYDKQKKYHTNKGTWNASKEHAIISQIALAYSKIGTLKTKPFEVFVEELLRAHSKRKKGPKVMDMLNKVMSPKANGFKLNKLSTSDNDNEIWIGNGPIILARDRMWLELEEMGFIK